MKWTMIGIALLTLASCQNKEHALDPQLEGFFPGDAGEVRKPNQFADVQAAAGARNDAMLSRQHFDGPRLNSLGEEKLSYMLQDDDAPAPMTVYLNLSEKDAVSKARQASVLTFLKDKGLADNQVSVLYGDNPAARSAAATHLARLKKTESGEAGGTSGGTDGASDAQGGGSTGGSDAGGTATTK
jgi:hypothetical protein